MVRKRKLRIGFWTALLSTGSVLGLAGAYLKAEYRHTDAWIWIILFGLLVIAAISLLAYAHRNDRWPFSLK